MKHIMQIAGNKSIFQIILTFLAIAHLSEKTYSADISQSEKFNPQHPQLKPDYIYFQSRKLENDWIKENEIIQINNPTNKSNRQKDPLIEELEKTDADLDGVDITDELIKKMYEEDELDQKYMREFDEFIYETLEKTKLETEAVKIAGAITRETLPLLTGGAVATGLGVGGIAVLGLAGITAPISIPIAVAGTVGGAIWIGLRLGVPEFFEKIPLKIKIALNKADLSVEGGAFTNRKLIFKES